MGASEGSQNATTFPTARGNRRVVRSLSHFEILRVLRPSTLAPTPGATAALDDGVHRTCHLPDQGARAV